jgi:hypothetical protein
MVSQFSSRAFPGFNKVFWLRDPVSNRPYRGEMDTQLGENFSFTRCEAKPAKPVAVKHIMGEAVPRDVIWTTNAILLIVSERFIDILLDNHFTGWTTYPVEVYSKDDELLKGFHGFCVSGRCGPIDYKKSEIVYVEYPARKVPKYKGIYFDTSSWDGSDFFMPSDNVGFIFIFEAVKKALEKAKIRNISFERLDEFVHSIPK